MHVVHVCLEITDERYRAIKAQAECSGTTVERLVEQMVQGLVEELDQEERDGDHLIIPC